MEEIIKLHENPLPFSLHFLIFFKLVRSKWTEPSTTKCSSLERREKRRCKWMKTLREKDEEESKGKTHERWRGWERKSWTGQKEHEGERSEWRIKTEEEGGFSKGVMDGGGQHTMSSLIRLHQRLSDETNQGVLLSDNDGSRECDLLMGLSWIQEVIRALIWPHNTLTHTHTH